MKKQLKPVKLTTPDAEVATAVVVPEQAGIVIHQRQLPANLRSASEVTGNLESLMPTLESDPLTMAETWCNHARRAQHVTIFSMLMAGLAIGHAKKQLGVSTGKRTDLSKDPRLADGWKGFVKKHLGISDVTALKYEKLAELARKRFTGLKDVPLSELLSLGGGGSDALEKALAKLCDGKEAGEVQQLLALDSGLAKHTRGAKSKGGHKGEGESAPLVYNPDIIPDEVTGLLAEKVMWQAYCKASEKGRAAMDLILPVISGGEDAIADETLAALPDAPLQRLRALAVELAKLIPAPKGGK